MKRRGDEVIDQDKFKIGQMYFIGGYHDAGRKYPCVIRPVVYLGEQPKRKQQNADGFETYAFEDMESWFERKGQGKPSVKRIEYVEGPAEMTLVMDLDQLIEDLIRLCERTRHAPK